MNQWIKGTRLRPYLDVLSNNAAEESINEITEKASKTYEQQENGEIIFRFRRYTEFALPLSFASFVSVVISCGTIISSMSSARVIGRFGTNRVAAFSTAMTAAALLFLNLPLWKKAHGRADRAEERKAKALTLREIAGIPGVRLMWCLFIASCAIECICGGWGATFLVEHKHMAAEQAAGAVMFYYMGMALGRFLSGILAMWLDSWKIIRIGQCVLGAAVVVLLLPVQASVAGLFMVGLGNGPLFPNFNYLTPQNFGEDASQAVMGTQMAASYVGIMLAPAVCGMLGQAAGMWIFPVYLAAFYVVLVVATGKAKRILKDAHSF